MIAEIALATAVRFVTMHFTVNAYGVPGTGTIVVDRLTGRFSRSFSAGPASEQEGYDLEKAWRADATGTPRVQGNSGERREIIEWSTALKGAINAAAHHAHLSGAADHVDVSFEQYRKVADLTLPGRIVSRSEQNGLWTAELSNASTSARLPAATFSPPKRTSRDIELSHVTRIPISMAIGSPVLPVRVNGTSLQFLFDTGGQNVITAEAAKRLGLNVLGSGVVSGGGGGTTSIAFATVRSLQVGDAKLVDQPFIVLPAESLPPVDGIVGYELLARLAARLDMMHGTLELAPRASDFGPPVSPVAFDYFDRQPQVRGSLDGIRGGFTIDTGSSLTAQVQAPVVRDQHLVRRMNATVAAYANDVGGRYPIYLVRADTLQLGKALFPQPLVDLLTRSGSSDNATIVANVGDGILRRWVIVFDYPHTTIDLRPGGDPSGNVVRDRSGLILMAKGDGVTVAQVLQGTPASEAGLTEGAQIVAIDGNAVTGADLAHIRTMLQGTPGTLLRVHLADGTTHDLSLRQYL